MGRCRVVQMSLEHGEAGLLGGWAQEKMREEAVGLHRAMELRYDQREPPNQEDREELFYQALGVLILSDLAGMFRRLVCEVVPACQERAGEVAPE